MSMASLAARPSPSNEASARSMLRSDLGPAGGRPPMKSIIHGRWCRFCRFTRARSRMSRRQSPDGSPSSSPPRTASIIRSSSSSLDAMCQYSDIVPAFSSRAIRRMLIASAPDMSTGLIDRFRSLPMSRAAVLAGRTLADLLTQAIGALVVAGVGLAIGWRVHTGPADALAAFGLALLFGYAFSWAGACLGMVLRSPESAQQLGFILFLPLTFISNAFVPTQGMPGWLRAVADWNPFSALAAASRHLFGNPNPAATVHAWPMQHPELAVLAWSAALLLVFAPLAVRLYRRKSLG